jgi:serine/threonine protein kinase
VPAPPDGGLSQRTSVTVFFVGQLAHATDGFSDALRIGGGGFGSVYKAALLTGGAGPVGTAYAAVKKLDPSSMQGQSEFLQEVQVLGGCRHENLLPLIGFSADQGMHHEHAGVCLVMPLMKGGSLQDRLFLDTSARSRLSRLSDMAGVAGGAPADVHEALTGIERLSVLFGAVKGLEYLHTPDPAIFKPVIMHRDIKPSNIVLDADLHARLAGL